MGYLLFLAHKILVCQVRGPRTGTLSWSTVFKFCFSLSLSLSLSFWSNHVAGHQVPTANDRFPCLIESGSTSRTWLYTNTTSLLGNSRRGAYIKKRERRGLKRGPSGLCNSSLALEYNRVFLSWKYIAHRMKYYLDADLKKKKGSYTECWWIEFVWGPVLSDEWVSGFETI